MSPPPLDRRFVTRSVIGAESKPAQLMRAQSRIASRREPNIQA
jgi:hypothetical protein